MVGCQTRRGTLKPPFRELLTSGAVHNNAEASEGVECPHTGLSHGRSDGNVVSKPHGLRCNSSELVVHSCIYEAQKK